jgi:hypothetical protein
MKPEDTQKPEDLVPLEQDFQEEAVLPEDFTPLGDISSLPRARRRRAQRMLVPPGADERAALLEDLARRAFPSLEFFLFALLCGAVIGLGYLLNSPALLLLGLLIAPVLTPWVGMTLSVLTGSWRFFLQTLAGLAVAGLLVFLTGALAGFVGRFWQPGGIFFADLHSQIWWHSYLWWPDLLLTTLGAALLTISFVRSEGKPLLPSILLAYSLFLPLNAAGVGLGAGLERVWPDGTLVSLVHLALATLVGGIVLAILRFKPARIGGYVLPVSIGLVVVSLLAVLTGLVSVIRDTITSARYQAPTTVALPSVTSPPPQTSTASVSPTASQTSTLAPTLEPTPSYAVITSGGGALMRTEPGGGTVITSLINGSLVEVLPEIETVGTVPWVRVRTNDNIEGWVLQSVLTAAAFTPTSIPTSTPSFTPIPTQTATP